MYIQQPMFRPTSTWRPTPIKDLPRWADKRIGLDLETHDPQLTKLGPGPRRDGRIIGFSFCLDTHRRPYYVPIDHAGGGNVCRNHALQYLRDQVSAFRGEVVGANLTYDLDFLAEVGIEFHPSVKFRDVQLAAPLLNELHISYSLDAIAGRMGIPLKADDQLVAAGRAWALPNVKKEMWKLPAEFVGDYAEYDALLPLLILEEQKKELRSQDLWGVWELESDVLPVCLAMRRRGVAIDTKKLQEISDWALQVETEEMAKVKAATGVELGAGDTAKAALLARALGEIGIECPLTKKTKKPSVKADFLRAHDHPVTRAILRAKQFAKLRTTFCKQVWEQLIKGRVHCTFNQLRTEKPGQKDSIGAAFGRFSSTNFNIQNQPIRNKEYGKLWRSIYVPDSGRDWACGDFSSQEPRLAVHFACLMGYPGAESTAQLYRTNPGTDPHSATAAQMFPKQWARLSASYEAGPEKGGKEYEEAERLRSTSKTLFLGLCYGMGGGKLCVQLGLPTMKKSFVNSKGEEIKYLGAGPEGQRLLDQFHARVPYIGMLAKEAKRRAEIRGYVTTISGRRCRFRRFKGEYIETHKALNRIIQGSAGDQAKAALRDLHKAGVPIQMTIHDEFDWSASSKEEMMLVGEIMTKAIKLRVPSRVDIEYGPNWGQLENKL